MLKLNVLPLFIGIQALCVVHKYCVCSLYRMCDLVTALFCKMVWQLEFDLKYGGLAEYQCNNVEAYCTLWGERMRNRERSCGQER